LPKTDNLTDVPQFLRLPSGLVVNLNLISRVVPSVEQGTTNLTVHFAGGDVVILTPEDATALRRRLGSTNTFSGVKVGAFWVVILVAMALVYLSVRR